MDESFTYFGVSFFGFERPAVEFEGPATGPLIGSGEEDSVTEVSLVIKVVTGPLIGLGEEDSVTEELSATGTGVAERAWTAIGGAASYSGEGEADKLLGSDANRAATNAFEMVLASQAVCGVGVPVWEIGRGDDVSGTMSSPGPAADFYFARDCL